MYYRELDEAWAELTAPDAPFETTAVDIRGVPTRTFRRAPASVRDIWMATRAFSDRDYLVYREERLTYAQAHAQSAAAARWLLKHGVMQGDRVAIAMRNYPEWMILYWACLSIGVTVVGMNAWWVAEEMAFALEDSRPKVIVCDRERLDRLVERPEALEDLVVVATRSGQSVPDGVIAWQNIVAEHTGYMPDAIIEPDDDACIFYTSGTTGRPKGALLTHRGCVNNLLNLQFAARVQALALERAGHTPAVAAPPAPPVALLTTPLFHVTANNCAGYSTTAAGGTIVLMHRWDAGEALQLIERERVTSLRGVPVMSRELLHHPDFAKHDTSSLQTMGGGGAPLPPDLVARIDQSLAQARPSTGYGLTETSGIITTVESRFFIDKPGSVGRVMPTFEARCVDDAGADVQRGAPGELWVRGAPVIKEYINRPEATAEAITDGWFHTGDIARIDDEGFVHIVDRKKDMVLRGGENVYCAEVEACLYRENAVAECCVFGVPDERLGEEVAAAVYLRDGHSISAEALRTHCARQLSRHKAPRYIWLLTEPLPRNANGKFMKRDLRRMLAMVDAL